LALLYNIVVGLLTEYFVNHIAAEPFHNAVFMNCAVAAEGLRRPLAVLDRRSDCPKRTALDQQNTQEGKRTQPSQCFQAVTFEQWELHLTISNVAKQNERSSHEEDL